MLNHSCIRSKLILQMTCLVILKLRMVDSLQERVGGRYTIMRTIGMKETIIGRLYMATQ